MSLPELTLVAQAAHAGRAHAVLSASGSAMWMACPPSARLNDGIEDEDSDASLRGTLGHELLENMLLHYLGRRDDLAYKRRSKELEASEHYSLALRDKVLHCFDYAVERIGEARKLYGDDVVILVEQRIDFSQWVPEGFGAGDLCILTPGYFEVIDWKFGGIEVAIENNSQLRWYGTGLLSMYGVLYSPKHVITTIMQPFVGEDAKIEIVMSDDLLYWAEQAKPIAQLAWEGKGEFNPGEKQCRWCKVRGSCRARAEQMAELAQDQMSLGALLEDNELASVFLRANEFQRWLDAVRQEVASRALVGIEMPGLKLVRGRSNRRITEPAEATKLLMRKGYTLEEITSPPVPRELLGVTKLEELIGKKAFAETLDGLVMKPPGALEVVADSDPREAEIVRRSTADNDFN